MRIKISCLVSLVLITGMIYAGDGVSVRISNIKENQEVSGYLVAELDTAQLAGIRWVSWCMDGDLIANVYEAPFTMGFDTRDFPNGIHDLSARVLPKNGILENASVRINIQNGETPFNFIIGGPEKLVEQEGIPIHNSYIDAPHSAIKKNDEELYFFHNKGLMKFVREKRGITTCTSGTLEHPYRTLEWSNYVPGYWDKNGHSTQGVWLMSMYHIGENELLGFTHNESCYNEDKPCVEDAKSFSLGLGYSSDNGRTWLFLGEIVRHFQYEEHPENNMGGVPYFLVDGYFYIYFQEYAENDVPYPGVARAQSG